jgi:hypothetical protein
MRIESGPTRERIVRTSLMLAMVGGFALWFGYDGWIGYPSQNRRELFQQLTDDERVSVGELKLIPDLGPSQSEKAQILITDKRRIPIESLRSQLDAIFAAPPSFESSEGWHYFGPDYRVKIPVENGRIIGRVVGTPTEKTGTDILLQKVLAGALGVIALYVAWFLVRIRATTLVLDDAGLVYRGRGPIAWDEMKALDSGRFKEKGFVDLIHDEYGTERRLRLDEYHIARFEDVIDEVCARKGFENPIPVEDEDQAKDVEPVPPQGR